MLEEVQIEGLGIMRQMNDYQIARVRVMRGPNRNIAPMAFGLGMTIQQFKKLRPDQKRAAWEAHNRLVTPFAALPTGEQPPRDKRLPRAWERISDEQAVQIGRDLLVVKKSLPRGHFGPWVREKSGISPGRAQKYMKAAKERAAAD